MYASHASYSACGLGSDGTDLLVDLARAAGAAAGIYGAKITGGGSGGTVAILAREDAADRVRRIAAEYAERTGREPYVFEGTSDGAAITGATHDSDDNRDEAPVNSRNPSLEAVNPRTREPVNP